MSDELERLARAATKGPWRAGESYMPGLRDLHIPGGAVVEIHERDAYYIAAASPDVVLKLLAELATIRGLHARAVVWANDRLHACARTERNSNRQQSRDWAYGESVAIRALLAILSDSEFASRIAPNQDGEK